MLWSGLVVKTERLTILLSRNAIEILLGRFLCVTRMRREYKSEVRMNKILFRFYLEDCREIGRRVSIRV